MTNLRFDALWRPAGWLAPAFVSIDAGGNIVAISDQPLLNGPVEARGGLALPGLCNLHSHAFQRVLLGRTEHAAGHSDNFWTWREAMYRSVATLTPEAVQAVAAWLYVEMLEAGYTSVGEFHYLHHDPNGDAYENPAELALRVLTAARSAGIGVTLLPVLYQLSGFDGQAAGASQRRFVCSVDELLTIVEAARQSAEGDANAAVGIAPHSLRAVSAETLPQMLSAVSSECPVHIHISEQEKEVQECLAATGATPIQRLLSAVEVDKRFCLVHATHATTAELRALARTGACVALCPTTEANLGDGLAPALELLSQRIPIGIGSDSQVCVSPAEELRLLEYGQRLERRQRNVLVSPDHASVAARLLAEIGQSAEAVLARRVGKLEVGARADLVVLDPESPALWGLPPAQQLDAWIFGSRADCVRDVMVGGKWVVSRGKHHLRDALFSEYTRRVSRIL